MNNKTKKLIKDMGGARRLLEAHRDPKIAQQLIKLLKDML